jgi:hypothetical protein
MGIISGHFRIGLYANGSIRPPANSGMEIIPVRPALVLMNPYF